MKPQGQYNDLVAAFNARQKEVRFKQVHPVEVPQRLFRPRQAELVRLYYLGYGRNAWHNTRVNIFDPGDVSIKVSELQRRAERLRTSGSQFWIEARDALWIRFPKTSIVMLEINKADRRQYERLAISIQPGSLRDFWWQCRFAEMNWLLFLECSIWAPKSAPLSTPYEFKAHPNGSGRPLGWTKHSAELNPDFALISDSIVGACRPAQRRPQKTRQVKESDFPIQLRNGIL